MIRGLMISFCALAMALCISPATARAADKLSSEDKSLIKDAMRDLEMGAQSGRLARTQTDTDKVQHFAESVVQDNSKMIKQLHDFASDHDFNFDGDPTKPDVKTKKELEDSKNREFDRRYLSMAVHEHEEMLDIWKKGANDAKNSELRDWFEKGQGTIKENLGTARHLYQDVKDKDADDKKSEKHHSK